MKIKLYSDGLANPKIAQLVLWLGKHGHHAVLYPVNFLKPKLKRR